MEKDFMSSLQCRDAQLPYVRSTELQLDSGLQSKPVSMNLNCPVQGLTLPHRDEEPHSWFPFFPQLRQSFISGAKMALDEKLLCGTEHSKPVQPSTTRCNPKQFLVFDQSGDRTTLIYSPTTGGASVYMNSNLQNNSNAAKMEIWSETRRLSGPNLSDELNAKDSEDEEWSNVHEDTEEINALLYSDDESDHDESYDDEETSTGHSPCVMTNEKELEDVASSGGCAKRRRISHDEYESRSLMDTASSAMADRSRTLQFEVDDAESKLADDHVQLMKKDNSTDACKRSRIRETVEILRRIVPGAKGKGSMAILEESIRYLRSLKEKAECSGFVGLEADAFSAT